MKYKNTKTGIVIECNSVINSPIFEKVKETTTTKKTAKKTTTEEE